MRKKEEEQGKDRSDTLRAIKETVTSTWSVGRPSSHCVWCIRIRSFCLLKTCGDKSAPAQTDSQGGITGRARTGCETDLWRAPSKKCASVALKRYLLLCRSFYVSSYLVDMSKCFWISSVTHVNTDMLKSPHTYLISCCSCNTCHRPQYLLIKHFVTHEQSSASVASPNITLTFTQSFLTVHKQITSKYPVPRLPVTLSPDSHPSILSRYGGYTPLVTSFYFAFITHLSAS